MVEQNNKWVTEVVKCQKTLLIYNRPKNPKPLPKKIDGSKSISPKYKIDLIPFLGHTCILTGNYSTPFMTCQLVGQAALYQDSPNSCPPHRWRPKAPWWETKMEALDVLVLPGFKWPFWGVLFVTFSGVKWPPFGEIKRSRMEEALEIFVVEDEPCFDLVPKHSMGRLYIYLKKFD